MKVPEPKVGENLRVVAAREKAGRLDANARLTNVREWYANLKADYGSPGGP